jgi:type 1 fimbriae regulatory protein FimB
MQRRKHLTVSEIRAMLDSALRSSDPERNMCLILLIYYHGLRASEARLMLLSDLSIEDNTLFVRRSKGSLSTNQPLIDDEVEPLKSWLAVREKMPLAKRSDYLFITKRGTHFSRQRIYTLVKEIGNNARLQIAVHPHMLRHSCGFSLADKGADTRVIQDYLGHKNIRHTVHYTASNSLRFRGLWDKKG